jgi:LPXTG-motif cell wall-anchored protein
LRSYVFVRAIDRAGNIRMAVVAPRSSVTGYEKNIIWVIIMILALVAGGVLSWRVKTARSKR